MVLLELVVVLVLLGTTGLAVHLLHRRQPTTHHRHHRQGSMLGFFKKSKPDAGHVSFLMKADACLQQAAKTQDVRNLSKYFADGECLQTVLKRVRKKEDADSGIASYRHVSWEQLEFAGFVYTYIMNVTYDDIKMSKGIYASVGDAHREKWKVYQAEGAAPIVIYARRILDD